jgi:N-acetylmuramoyl-L-alanine amidase
MAWVSRARTEKVRHVVIHHTGCDLESSLRILSGRDADRRVSCHYLVTDESPPRVVALVPESRVAFHAGESHWRGRAGLNATSVGIEVVHPDGNLADYPQAQVEAVAALVVDVVARHGVDPRDVVAHSDIAPGRKVDPGTRFPWERLHRRHGIGTWPSDVALAAERAREAPLPHPGTFRQLLAAWGYPVGVSAGWDAADGAALAAFQRRYRPSTVDGRPDRECADLLRALLATYPDTP